MTYLKYGMVLYVVGDSFQYDGGMVPQSIYSTRKKAEEAAAAFQCVEQLFQAVYWAVKHPVRPVRSPYYKWHPNCHYEVVEVPWYWAT